VKEWATAQVHRWAWQGAVWEPCVCKNPGTKGRPTITQMSKVCQQRNGTETVSGMGCKCVGTAIPELRHVRTGASVCWGKNHALWWCWGQPAEGRRHAVCSGRTGCIGARTPGTVPIINKRNWNKLWWYVVQAGNVALQCARKRVCSAVAGGAMARRYVAAEPSVCAVAGQRFYNGPLAEQTAGITLRWIRATHKEPPLSRAVMR